MTRKVKLLIYGAPGVGKSVFSSQFPRPFVIATDGNYEWLRDFGAKLEDHHQVTSWAEFVKFIQTKNFDNYDTIVVDLLEDLYKWAEDEFNKKHKIEFIGDLAYGKGYTIVRDGFFNEISRLINKPFNIVLISHENVEVSKDRFGTERSSFSPSKMLPTVLRDKIEGKLRYVLRAKFMDVEEKGKVSAKRILSLAKDPYEFSIIRGVDMNTLPDMIELSYKEFVKTLKLDDKKSNALWINEESKPEVETKTEVFEEVPIPKPIKKPVAKVATKVEVKEVQAKLPLQEDEEDEETLFDLTPPTPVKKVEPTPIKEVEKTENVTDKLSAIQEKIRLAREKAAKK